MDIELKSVERKAASNGQFYLVLDMEVTDDGGTTLLGRRMMPVDALEWRAAEYGIPPEDLDTLLDVVIYENFLGEPDRPDLMLHDAPTIEDAREYHLARVKAAKDSAKKVKADADDPVRGRIKELVVMNPEAIELKKSRVKRIREDRAEKRSQAIAAINSGDDEIRLERLRKTLTPRPSTRDNGKERKNG